MWYYFPGGSDGKESSCNAGDPGLTPGMGRSPGEGNSNPLQYSCLEKPMDRGAWRAYSPWCHEVLDRTEWLNSSRFWPICLNMRYLFFSLWLTSLCMTLSSLGPSMSLQITQFPSFYSWVILHYIYVQLLFPFLSWWTLRLLPKPRDKAMHLWSPNLWQSGQEYTKEKRQPLQ